MYWPSTTSETEPTAPSKVSTIAISSAISCEAAVQMKIGPPGVLVLVGDLEHPRVQPRQHAGQHVGREPLQVAHPDALEQLADAVAQRVRARVGRAAQAEEDVLPRVARPARGG